MGYYGAVNFSWDKTTRNKQIITERSAYFPPSFKHVLPFINRIVFAGFTTFFENCENERQIRSDIRILFMLKIACEPLVCEAAILLLSNTSCHSHQNF
jgi:hypothetical protein